MLKATYVLQNFVRIPNIIGRYATVSGAGGSRLRDCRQSFLVFAPLAFLAGCGGGGSSNPVTSTGLEAYVGKSYSEKAIIVNGAMDNLTLTVPSSGKVSGSLTPAASTSSRLESGLTYSYEGDMSLVTGGVSFVGTFGSLIATIQGTLPNAPSTTGGSFTITYGGQTYGPFPFGGTYSTGTGTGASYSVTVLPQIAGLTDMVPYSINSSGEVVGYASSLSAGHAFKWTASGGTVDLTNEPGFPKGSNSSLAIQVNDAGQICGNSYVYSNLLSTSSGFLENNGSISTFSEDAGFEGLTVAGLFADGTVIASETVASNDGGNITQTVGFKGGKATPIGNSNDVFALGVNPIANFTTGIVSYAGATQQWFTFTEGGSIDKVPASSYANFNIRDISGSLVTGPNGEIVVDRTDNQHIEIYGGPNANVDTGVSGTPTSINGAGVVTVNGTTPEIWSKAGGLVSLQSRIPTSLNLTLDGVEGINNAGQVICHGKLGTGASLKSVAVLISPSK
jgi:hypothetical protein